MIINENLQEIQKRNEKSKRSFLVYVFILIVILLSIASLNYSGYFVVLVEGSSMENTLFSGDKLIAKETDELNYGDVIIIRVKDNLAQKRIIKRVIGLEGDVIELRYEDGHYYVYRNGLKLDEPYARGETEPRDGGITRWVVGRNEVFFLGDNRENSKDSRFFDFGMQKLSNVEGVVRNWSIDLRWLNNSLLFWMSEGVD